MFFEPRQAQRLRQIMIAMHPDVYAERLGQMYKLYLQHMFCSFFFISDVRSRCFYVQCAEALFFTTYYCVRIKDMHFFYRLPVVHLLCLLMMYHIEQKFGTMIILSLAQLLYPGYKCYIHSLYVRGCIQFAIRYVTGYNIPEYSYLFFYCLETLRRYIFLFRYKSPDDLSMIAVFAIFFYSTLYCKEKLNESQLVAMLTFLFIWTLIKRDRVPFGGTLMNPVPMPDLF